MLLRSFVKKKLQQNHKILPPEIFCDKLLVKTANDRAKIAGQISRQMAKKEENVLNVPKDHGQ